MSYDGITTTGKTTTLNICASIWGKPTAGKGVVHTWNATRVWLEETLGMCSGLPVFLDDTQNVSARDTYIIKDIIYDVAQGKGKGRGNIVGQRASKEWKTALFSTGEQPILSFSNDGGTHARTISIFDSPFEGDDKAETVKLIDEAMSIISDNYGVIGEAVASKLLEAGQVKLLKNSYRYYLNKILDRLKAEKCKSHIAGRIAKIFSLLGCGVELLRDTGCFDEKELSVQTQMVEDFCVGYCMDSGLEEADKVEEARLYVLDWAAINMHRFYNENYSNAEPPHSGWAGRFDRRRNSDDTFSVCEGIIYWDKHTLIDLLNSKGFHAKTILKKWQQANITGHPSRKTRKDGTLSIRLNQASVRAVSMPIDGVR